MNVTNDSKNEACAEVDFARSENVVRYGPGSFIAHPPTAEFRFIRDILSSGRVSLTDPNFEARLSLFEPCHSLIHRGSTGIHNIHAESGRIDERKSKVDVGVRSKWDILRLHIFASVSTMFEA